MRDQDEKLSKQNERKKRIFKCFCGGGIKERAKREKKKRERATNLNKLRKPNISSINPIIVHLTKI